MTRIMTAARLRDLLGLVPTSRPGYRDLAESIRMLVADGRVVPETRLPSERELTAALGVSRTTVSRAYEELRDAGYALSRRGSGSVVTLPGRQPAQRLLPTPDLLAGPLHEDGKATIGWTIAAGQAAPGVGLAYARALEALPTYLTQTGYMLAGVETLRTKIAHRFAERGLPTDADQIIVTSGAQSALTLIARSIGRVGDRVIVESPTYPNAIDSLRRSGLRPVGVPLDHDGWHVPSVETVLRQTAPAFAYLLPDFQNPTGALMDAQTRMAIGAALTASGTVPIVDETMCELNLDLDDSQMPPPLAAFASGAITTGSASKSFWGGLRLGWIRAPHDLVLRLLQGRAALDLGTPVLEQLVLSELLDRRTTVMAEQRALLRERRARLTALIEKHLPDWRFGLPRGGLCLWVTLPARVSTSLASNAERERLLVAAGPRFFVGGGGERHLRLPFSREEDDLEEAVERLARAYTRTVGAPGRAATSANTTLTA